MYKRQDFNQDLVYYMHGKMNSAGDTPNVDIGPLVTGIHRDKVAGYIAAGVAEGATLVLDGREGLTAELKRGFFLNPTLFDLSLIHI